MISTSEAAWPDHFAKRSDSISLMIVSAHLSIVLLPVYVAAALGPGWNTVLCWVLFGTGMNGILNLMHECAHYHVFRERRWSDALGRWVIGPMVFANFDSYRRRHWDHHRFAGVEGETKDTYLIDIQGKNLFWFWCRCAFMIEALRKFAGQADPRATADGGGLKIWRVLVFHVMFLISLLVISFAFNRSQGLELVALSALVSYGVVFVYGLASLTVFMAALRAIAEHQQYDDESAHRGYAALRNFSCNTLSRFLMGCYGFGEHYTHHQIPGIPYYHLKAAAFEAAKSDPAAAARKGYFQVLGEIIAGSNARR
jgi:fatty acid desaturase